MRYWILVFLLCGLFTLITGLEWPELTGTPVWFTGIVICCLVALAVTWNDPVVGLENLLFPLLKLCVPLAGAALTGYGLACLTGQKRAQEAITDTGMRADMLAASDLPLMALLAGVGMLAASGLYWWWRWRHQ